MAVRRLVFLFGVPLLFSTYLTFSSGPLLEDPGYLPTFVFYVGHALPPWLLTALTTHVAMILLAPWRPRLVILAIAGSITSCLIILPYINWLGATLDWSAYAIMRPPVSENAYILFSLVKSTVIWVVVNVIFDRYFGLPRYRYPSKPHVAIKSGVPDMTSAGHAIRAGFIPAQPPVSASDPAASTANTTPVAAPENYVPPFIARLEQPISLDELIAVKSEQHYLQVIANGRRQLVLYRLSDAVGELPPGLGVQVHRSWWVAHNAMAGMSSQGRRMTLKLVNGTQVPVSMPHQQLVRRLLEARQINGRQHP